MTIRACPLWFLGAVMLTSAPLGAQTAIRGTVVETESGAPVEGATVVLLDRASAGDSGGGDHASRDRGGEQPPL